MVEMFNSLSDALAKYPDAYVAIELNGVIVRSVKIIGIYGLELVPTVAVRLMENSFVADIGFGSAIIRKILVMLEGIF